MSTYEERVLLQYYAEKDYEKFFNKLSMFKPYIIRDKNGWTLLHLTCKNRKVHHVERLLKEFPGFFDVNDVNNGKGTALHQAVMDTSSDIVKILITHGANPLIPNSIGLTPLEFARKKKMYGIVKLLEEASEQFSEDFNLEANQQVHQEERETSLANQPNTEMNPTDRIAFLEKRVDHVERIVTSLKNEIAELKKYHL
jgi:ankyrin repeat protein